ncbi:MAG: hypothetical protein LRY32_00185 [Flavobacterium sp.]|nr:hypothetical protein [Flavobacterium sp.]
MSAPDKQVSFSDDCISVKVLLAVADFVVEVVLDFCVSILSVEAFE